MADLPPPTNKRSADTEESARTKKKQKQGETTTLPNVGRVRREQRVSAGRTRLLDRPSIPTWIFDPARSEEAEETLQKAATDEYCREIVGKARDCRTRYQEAYEVLKSEQTSLQFERVILEDARELVQAEIHALEADAQRI